MPTEPVTLETWAENNNEGTVIAASAFGKFLEPTEAQQRIDQ